MTVLEIMERTGVKEVQRIISYIDDALYELEVDLPHNSTGAMYDISANVRTYTFPAGMVNLQGVYMRYNTDGEYIRIPEVSHLDSVKPSSGVASGTSSDDIIVI